MSLVVGVRTRYNSKDSIISSLRDMACVGYKKSISVKKTEDRSVFIQQIFIARYWTEYYI